MNSVKSVILALLFLSSDLVLAEDSAAVFRCTNVARSPVTFRMQVKGKQLKLQFGNGSDGSQLEDELKSRSLTLPMETSSSLRGWAQYNAELLVNHDFGDYREVQIRFRSEDLLKSKSLRVIMSPSNTHSKDSSGDVFTQYEMICQRP